MYTEEHKHGGEMSKRPRQPKLTLVISDDLRRKARVKAITQGTTLSAVVREFLEEWVKDDPPQDEQGGEKPPKSE